MLWLLKTLSEVLRGHFFPPRIPVMQTSNSWKCHNLPLLRRLNLAGSRRVLPEPKMGAILMMIVDVGPNHARELSLVDGDHMIKTVAAGGYLSTSRRTDFAKATGMQSSLVPVQVHPPGV